ncbi:MAG: ferritin family protein [Desulfobacterales bacterium]
MAEKQLMELIDTAIRREEQAFDFYTDILGKIDDDFARETIEEIAKEEKKHKAFLVKYRDENWTPKDLKMSDVNFYKIAEYQEEPEISSNMKSEDVYLVASHRELRSYKFYTEIAGLHPDGEVKDLLLKMANEELKHKEKVEYLYANTAFPQTDGG